MQYPLSRTVDVVDDHHGTPVPDPYRWLEDPDADDTRAWIEAQNALTFGYLERLPWRRPLRDRLTALWNHERMGTPWRVADRVFWLHNDGLQNQSVLYVRDDGGDARVLLDANALSEDGTVSLGALRVRDDGRMLAYSISESGSDWRTWRVRDVTTGEDLDDAVRWSKFSGASWAHDGSGFYYSRYDAPRAGEEYEQANRDHQVWFHRLGTAQEKDELVYRRPDRPEWGFGAQVTEDGHYLVLSVWRGTDPRNGVFVRDLHTGGDFVELLADFDADYTFVGNEGSVLYFRTDLDAPRGRLIAIDLRRPDRADWATILPEGEDVLQSVRWTGGVFVANRLHHASDRVTLHARDGSIVREVDLPTFGTVGGFGGRSDAKETWYSFTSFLHPTVIHRYDFTTGESEVFFEPAVDFDRECFTTTQVFCPSTDGTRVPVFLVHRRDVVLDGDNPTLLYGYGGFNVSLTPGFSVSRLVWLERGGVLAVANLRGGGEYGEDWHRAGTFERKQNVFDDFVAVAEWLIEERWTRPERLACQGGSNGGLLVGAVLNQRPDLWRAALPAVGVMDMLRFHRFTIGWAWVSDYGSSDDPEQFRTLLAYSPYHNLTEREYPAVLVTTADHDDRVVPLHSFKYAARLQSVQRGDAPVLIRIETKAGHGEGKPTAKVIEETADVLAFLIDQLGMDPGS